MALIKIILKSITAFMSNDFMVYHYIYIPKAKNRCVILKKNYSNLKVIKLFLLAKINILVLLSLITEFKLLFLS